MDLSKAFDYTTRELLIVKLCAYGFKYPSLSLPPPLLKKKKSICQNK